MAKTIKQEIAKPKSFFDTLAEINIAMKMLDKVVDVY
jgi:hypothetical protein